MMKKCMDYEVNGVRPTGNGKGFPYSLPSVGLGADPGVQAVSPKVTINHPRGGRLPYFLPGLQLPSQPQSITTPWPVPSYTARWQRYMGVNNLPKVITQLLPEYRNWTHDLLIASPTLYPLHHRATPRGGWPRATGRPPKTCRKVVEVNIRHTQAVCHGLQ